MHLLPGQTILELGCGELRLTRALLQVSRGENPITAVTFQDSEPDVSKTDEKVEFLQLSDLPGPLRGRQFDCVIGMDLLDRVSSASQKENFQTTSFTGVCASDERTGRFG